jgi:hypothetical protein
VAAGNPHPGYQPLDSDLTAIAALATTAFGRGLLALADAAAGRTALGLGTAATHATGDYDAAGAAAAAQAASQPLDSDLTAIAALATTAFGRGLLALADAAAGRASLVAAHAAALSRFIPNAVGRAYKNPLNAATFNHQVMTQSQLAMHVFYSGEEGVTIDWFDIFLNAVGSSGAVCRIGVYQVTDQAHPFAFTLGSKYADLMAGGDLGTLATDAGTGQKKLTPGSPFVVAARTWFCVAGCDQVAAPADRYTAQASSWASPYGASGTNGTYALNEGIALAVNGITGALPAAFTPSGIITTDDGVGIHRSA